MMKFGEEKKTAPAPSRRRFLARAWIALGLLASAETAAAVAAFLWPRGSRPAPGAPGALVEAGPVDGFAPGSVTAFVRGRFYLARLADGGFLALSRRCTHLGCTVPWIEKENRFICPCHGSTFDIRGDVLTAPAPRALDRYRVFIRHDRVMVDTGRPIRRGAFQVSQATYPDKT